MGRQWNIAKPDRCSPIHFFSLALFFTQRHISGSLFSSIPPSMDFVMGLFGRSKEMEPKEQVREWCKNFRKEERKLERQVNAIRREEQKVTRSLKEAAKKGDKDVCKILAKEVVNSRKAVNRIYSAKANLNSCQLQMKEQLATLKVAGALSSSTEVMKVMQQLVKFPEIQKTMMDMSREMMKAGILEEMLDDTMETLDDPDIEEEVESEVDKVLFELTEGKLGLAPEAVKDSPLPAGRQPVQEEEEEDPGALEEMQSRLEALRS